MIGSQPSVPRKQYYRISPTSSTPPRQKSPQSGIHNTLLQLAPFPLPTRINIHKTCQQLLTSINTQGKRIALCNMYCHFNVKTTETTTGAWQWKFSCKTNHEPAFLVFSPNIPLGFKGSLTGFWGAGKTDRGRSARVLTRRLAIKGEPTLPC